MKLAIDAVYKDEAFHPTTPPTLPLTDGQHVRLTIEEEASSEMIGLLTDVYAGLSADEIDAIEKIALDRRTFFCGVATLSQVSNTHCRRQPSVACGHANRRFAC